MKRLFLVYAIGLFLLGAALGSLTDRGPAAFDRASTATGPTPAGGPQPTPLLLVGELASFEAKAGLESLKNNPGALDVVNVFFYDLASDGSVTKLAEVDPQFESELFSLFQENGPELMLGIGNDYKPQRLDLVLSDPEVREQHIGRILALIQEKGYDGVVVNFENLRIDQTEAFTAYVEALSAAVHREGKSIAVSLNSKPQGRIIEGIDIVDVSRLVDRIEFNAYEEFGSWSGPGPIASIGWVEAIVRNIIAQGVPSDKVVLGTAHNGHDWIISPYQDLVADTTTKKILDLASSLGAQPVWDEQFQSHFFTYTDREQRDHLVWFEEARSFNRKVELAERFGLRGVALWFLGGEDPDIWQTIEFNSLN